MTDSAALARELGTLPLPDLMARATELRHMAWGSTVTYSRKVFVPLTNMCRDTCAYCTFVKHPDDPAAGIMTPEQVLATARKGEAQGCKEVLFSLGEKPELRYDAARTALAHLGYDRMTDYLADMCALVLRETTLLPHANAGTLADDELALLKPVSASMGMMLETVSRRLTRPGMPHHACPDKVPVQRLRTLDRAGGAQGPVHHRAAYRDRGDVGGPDRGASRHRGRAPDARPCAGGHHPELPAKTRHRHGRPPRTCLG